ncbi:hypothetical protein [Tabrizicola sp.]|jgi:hypothetical protein|uniref:hypothetical protein n=1 Tax=Tabrizicola sp. TaxID=2005166 RepID=UPI0025F56CA1|nr:hypothetical protein [Tabrizicola sp.]MBY0352108.1 hypothetical protein [Tabrizicola sp.]
MAIQIPKRATHKQYCEAATYAFELMATGVERSEAYRRASMRLDGLTLHQVEQYGEWRLLHLGEKWQAPPKGWQSQMTVDAMPECHLRWTWCNIRFDTAIHAHADALGVQYGDVLWDFLDQPAGKELRKRIEDEWPEEGVDYRALLSQHYRAMAGLEAPKALPTPPRLLTANAGPQEVVSA